MTGQKLVELEEKVATASASYHRVIFLVGPDGCARTEFLEMFALKHKWPVVNLGLNFAQELLDVPRRQRAFVAPEVLADLLSRYPGDVIVLDHIELLFDPELAQDPVKLIRSLSRNRTLLVSWPGASEGSTLNYAQPEHPEFFRQAVPDLIQVEMSGVA